MYIPLFIFILGPDYMANFIPANRAEISARLLKQILRKPNCRMHGEEFSPGRNSARPNGPENLKKSHVSARAEKASMRIDCVFAPMSYLESSFLTAHAGLTKRATLERSIRRAVLIG